MRFFSRLTILARGFTRRPRSRCRRSSSSTSSRDISRFPPITRSLARPQFRFLPRRCTVHYLSLFLLFFSASQFRFPFRRFIFPPRFSTIPRYTYTHPRPTHPPTHSPQPPRMPQGVYSSNGARVEEPSDTIGWNGRSLDRSIHRANDTGID